MSGMTLCKTWQPLDTDCRDKVIACLFKYHPI